MLYCMSQHRPYTMAPCFCCVWYGSTLTPAYKCQQAIQYRALAVYCTWYGIRSFQYLLGDTHSSAKLLATVTEVGAGRCQRMDGEQNASPLACASMVQLSPLKWSNTACPAPGERYWVVCRGTERIIPQIRTLSKWSLHFTLVLRRQH